MALSALKDVLRQRVVALLALMLTLNVSPAASRMLAVVANSQLLSNTTNFRSPSHNVTWSVDISVNNLIRTPKKMIFVPLVTPARLPLSATDIAEFVATSTTNPKVSKPSKRVS